MVHAQVEIIISTRMASFINTKLMKSDRPTNIDKSGVAAHMISTEKYIILKF